MSIEAKAVQGAELKRWVMKGLAMSAVHELLCVWRIVKPSAAERPWSGVTEGGVCKVNGGFQYDLFHF